VSAICCVAAFSFIGAFNPGVDLVSASQKRLGAATLLTVLGVTHLLHFERGDVT
jgi:hypothetical protein